MSTPYYCRKVAFDHFVAQLPHLHETTGLLQAAVAVAMHELPDVDPTQTETEIRRLVERVERRVRSVSEPARLAHLHDELFEIAGFRGNSDDYYNPLNSYLPAVLETRRGLPITLTLLYKCVAEGLGLKVHGINAPGHFLAQVETAEGPLYIDAFDGGRVLSQSEVYERIAQVMGQPVPVSNELLAIAGHRPWLSRILNNLQATFAQREEMHALAAMQELQTLLHSAHLADGR